MITAPRVGRAVDTTAGVGTGVIVGAAVGLALSGSMLGALVLGVAVLPAIACAVDVRRVLLAVVLFDIPLQQGTSLFYRDDAAAVGALGGLDISLTTLALLGLYGLWVVGALVRADVPRARFTSATPLVIYIGVTGLSVLTAADKQLAGFEVALLLQSLLLFIYVTSHVRSRDDVFFVVTVLLAGLFVESLFVVADWAGLPLPLRPSVEAIPIGETVRLGGTIGSPNTAGAYFAGLVPLAAALSLAPAPRRVRRGAMLALTGGCVALLMTFSRGAWISAAIAIGVVTVSAFRRGWLSTSRPVLLAGPIALGAPLFPMVVERFTANDNGAAASRGPLTAMARGLIADNPVLGVGANNVGKSIAATAGPEFTHNWIYTVHNKYLLVWAGAGPAALVAFLWFLARAIRHGVLAARSIDPMLAAIAVALTAAVVGQLFHMTMEIFQSRPQVQLLWVTAALLAAMARLDEEAGRA